MDKVRRVVRIGWVRRGEEDFRLDWRLWGYWRGVRRG